MIFLQPGRIQLLGLAKLHFLRGGSHWKHILSEWVWGIFPFPSPFTYWSVSAFIELCWSPVSIRKIPAPTFPTQSWHRACCHYSFHPPAKFFFSVQPECLLSDVSAMGHVLWSKQDLFIFLQDKLSEKKLNNCLKKLIVFSQCKTHRVACLISKLETCVSPLLCSRVKGWP